MMRLQEHFIFPGINHQDYKPTISASFGYFPFSRAWLALSLSAISPWRKLGWTSIPTCDGRIQHQVSLSPRVDIGQIGKQPLVLNIPYCLMLLNRPSSEWCPLKLCTAQSGYLCVLVLLASRYSKGWSVTRQGCRN